MFAVLRIWLPAVCYRRTAYVYGYVVDAFTVVTGCLPVACDFVVPRGYLPVTHGCYGLPLVAVGYVALCTAVAVVAVYHIYCCGYFILYTFIYICWLFTLHYGCCYVVAGCGCWLPLRVAYTFTVG